MPAPWAVNLVRRRRRVPRSCHRRKPQRVLSTPAYLLRSRKRPWCGPRRPSLSFSPFPPFPLSFILSFNKYLLHTYYVPSTMLCARDFFKKDQDRPLPLHVPRASLSSPHHPRPRTADGESTPSFCTQFRDARTCPWQCQADRRRHPYSCCDEKMRSHSKHSINVSRRHSPTRGSVPSTSHAHLSTLTATLGGGCYFYPSGRGDETEPREIKSFVPRVNVEAGFEARQPGSRIHS